MLRMQLLQPFACDMRVNLCGRNIGMAEQQLHYAQISSVIKQMGGEGMAQGVWRQWLV